MASELPTRFDFNAIEPEIYRRWLENGAFAAVPDDRERRYVIMMPLPNVTGALHMGHAMDNVMQDLLIRWHRMQGANTLWQPGTDHAGIATQAVVEKRLFELEGKTRHDIGRDGLVARIWEWKDQYQQRIVRQQQQMGCSCDWDRQRFTMDPVCAAAVRAAFFRLFSDRLIYRGFRLVNWDCHLQTAVSDDEILHMEVQGSFWHLRYPVVDPQPGEPAHVVVATTRPETMLGDTAVACHPDPAGAIEARLAEARRKLERAPARERDEVAAEIARLEARRDSHLPLLERLAAMARAGRSVLLPLLDRPIPLILDEWAKPELGSGCVKITPAHDPNDYEVWQRHPEIGAVNILKADGSLNDSAGPYAGLDRFKARERVVADLEARGLLESVEPHTVDIGHSDRSKTPVEPFLSKQWFVRMGDVPGGIVCGKGTAREFRAAGLAQVAVDAASGRWRSPSGRWLEFHPDGDRYLATYTGWLAEKRDWCISRQLWWGHRIPVWYAQVPTAEELAALLGRLPEGDGLVAWVADPSGEPHAGPDAVALAGAGAAGSPLEVQVCLADEEAEERFGASLEALGLAQDPDVLDTWFSSALWPFSTQGWPDPSRARVEPGQRPLGPTCERPDSLTTYYPGSCLVTGRDIITLWVARMLMMGLYNLGDVPFTDVFIHAKILDGKGETMSKSKGNGIDPADIIARYGADAMRYVLCDMQTGTQDIRLPVQAICPAYDPATHSSDKVELAEAKHGRTVFTFLCPECGQEFDVLGTMDGLPAATIISDRFDIGRNFCTKLWNAARFTLMNLAGGSRWEPLFWGELGVEDQWILSRLSAAVASVTRGLEEYNPSLAIGTARDFFWGDLCDWYLEMIKPRLKDPARAAVARQVLALALDQVLRLLHPFVPFITEALWERLGEVAPVRGLDRPLPVSSLLVSAPWPQTVEAWRDPALESDVAFAQEVAREVRDVRNKHNVPPSTRLEVGIRASRAVAERLAPHSELVENLAGLSRLVISEDAERPPTAATRVVGEAEVHVLGVLDPVKERARLTKHRDEVSGQIRSSEARLANPGFVAKAPADVVEAARGRLAELEAELRRVEAALQALDG